MVKDMTDRNTLLTGTCTQLSIELESSAGDVQALQLQYDKLVIQNDALLQDNSALREALEMFNANLADDVLMACSQHTGLDLSTHHLSTADDTERRDRTSVIHQDKVPDTEHHMLLTCTIPEYGANGMSIAPESPRTIDVAFMSSPGYCYTVREGSLPRPLDSEAHSSNVSREELFSTPQLFSTDITIPDFYVVGSCVQDSIEGGDKDFQGVSSLLNLNVDVMDQHETDPRLINLEIVPLATRDDCRDPSSSERGNSKNISRYLQSTYDMSSDGLGNTLGDPVISWNHIMEDLAARPSALPFTATSFSSDDVLWLESQSAFGATTNLFSAPAMVANPDSTGEPGSGISTASVAATTNPPSPCLQEIKAVTRPQSQLGEGMTINQTATPSSTPQSATTVMAWSAEAELDAGSPMPFDLGFVAATLVSPSSATHPNPMHVHQTENFTYASRYSSEQPQLHACASPNSRSSEVADTIEQERPQTRCYHGEEEAVSSAYTERDSVTNSVSVAHEDMIIRNDEHLKEAIRTSYKRFGLFVQLGFRYGPGPFSATVIQLKTNWKLRAILKPATWEKLHKIADDLLGFFPKPDSTQLSAKEVNLLRRLCDSTTPRHEHRTLKDVAFALHRNSELLKDESRLGEFEFYSTLIVMEAYNQLEVSTLPKQTYERKLIVTSSQRLLV